MLTYREIFTKYQERPAAKKFTKFCFLFPSDLGGTSLHHICESISKHFSSENEIFLNEKACFYEVLRHIRTLIRIKPYENIATQFKSDYSSVVYKNEVFCFH